MICNRKAFVLASGCPQVVVNLSFPDLDFCSTPEYTEPTQGKGDGGPPRQIPSPDVNFPAIQSCFSVNIRMFTGDFSVLEDFDTDKPDARFVFKHVEASNGCNSSRAMGIQPLWGCQLAWGIDPIELINENNGGVNKYGELRFEASTQCSVEFAPYFVDLRNILVVPDMPAVCTHDGFMEFHGRVLNTDPGKRISFVTCTNTTCSYVTKVYTYYLTEYSSYRVTVTRKNIIKRVTCFIGDNNEVTCTLTRTTAYHTMSVLRYTKKSGFTHTFIATGFSCIDGNCCEILTGTILQKYKVVSKGTFRDEQLIRVKKVTIKMLVPDCEPCFTKVTGDAWYGTIGFVKHDCNIDGSFIIRDYGYYRKMAYHKLARTGAIVSMAEGNNVFHISVNSTFPCDILPPRLQFKLKVERLQVEGRGDIFVNEIGKWSYLVGAEDKTIYSGVTGERGHIGTIGPTGPTGNPGPWYSVLCTCFPEDVGECEYYYVYPCDVYPALCMYYNGGISTPFMLEGLGNVRAVGHNLIFRNHARKYIIDFNDQVWVNPRNIDTYVESTVFGTGVFC